MQTIKSFERNLYEVNDNNFENIALEVFRMQAVRNRVYHQYLTHLGVTIDAIGAVKSIPFLPITFFKNHEVKTGEWVSQYEFQSSGTTGGPASKHLVRSLPFYLENALRIFRNFYGDPSGYYFLALLPSYLEREGSSLIAMMDYFIRKSGSNESGFYLNQWAELARKIESLQGQERKIVLWGVSFALMDFAERYELDLSGAIVMETGGMKGRRSELTREELHAYLGKRFHVEFIHSEFGMTELFSQAYSKKRGYFKAPNWMKTVVRDIDDPFSTLEYGKSGTLNVVDLANLHSCCFIETQDLGRVYQDGSFEVLGRVDNTDRRGCNLLVE